MDWQADAGRSWAELFAQTDRSFGGLTQHLLERIARLAGKRVLDLGCGAGELSLAIARQRRGARIVGVDVSADLIAAARARAETHPEIEFVCADLAQWDVGAFAPDLLVSRHGVMFFDEPVHVFARLGDSAKSGANLVFSCFREREQNPWAGELAALLPEGTGAPPPPDAPGPFAFADRDRVRGILQAAGWRDVTFEPVDYAYVAGAGAGAIGEALAFFSRIGPAAAAIRAIQDAAERAACLERIESWLVRACRGDLVAFPAAAWIVSAHRD